MRKFIKLLLVSLIIITSYFVRSNLFAETEYENPNTNYEVVIQDDADLLSDDEINKLIEVMKPITQYGNVAFVTRYEIHGYYETADAAEAYYRKFFNRSSGTLFFIDMARRNIWIFSDGSVYRTITKAYANTITDNTYLYASNGDYYGCASEAFKQINILLEGGRISQPMRYISGALVAFIVAIFANYFVMLFQRKPKVINEVTATKEISKGVTIRKGFEKVIHSYRYDPSESSSSGGSGGGFSGGGGSSGGGSSGGGGGHGF